MDLEKLFPKDLYHSYVIEGDHTFATELLRFLEIRGEIVKQSQDVMYQNYDSFTMEDSHEIKNWHSMLGVTTGKKICIISARFINREAEQALLKIIEEPAINTHIFIIIPDSSLLQRTIISRVHVIKIDQTQSKALIDEITEFLKSKPNKRIEIITKIIKENKDENNSGQLRFYATSFVNQIESLMHKKFIDNKKDKNIKFILEELQKSRTYLSTPGASVKMILEHLALVI